MREVKVKLGGAEYSIKALAIRPAKEWRKKAGEPLEAVATALAGMGGLSLTSGSDLADLLNVLRETLVGSIDLLLDMLFSYSPDLAADRERIETQATDEEALVALAEVLKLAYPLGVLVDALRPEWPARQEDVDELARAEWGLWADELDETQLALLLGAYNRRKRFERKALAVEVVNTLSEAMGGGKNGKKKNESVSLEEMLSLSGGRLE